LSQPGHRRIVKNSALISAFNGIGVLTGLALDIAVAAYFGAGRVTDAFFLAFTLPQFLSLVLVGSYTQVLVPIFTAKLAEKGESGERFPKPAVHLFSLLLNLNLFGLGLLALVGWLLSPLIVSVIGAGADAQTRATATTLSRLLFLMLLPIGLAEVARALLFADDRFAAPAASNAIRYGGALITLLLAHQVWGIQALAVGYSVGAVAQLALMVLALARAGGGYRPGLWNFRDTTLRKAVRLLLIRMSGIGLRRSGLIFERFLGSFLPPGSITALGYARRMSLAFQQVFANSVSTAILPDLSAWTLARDVTAVQRGLVLGYRLLAFTMVPITMIIAVLSLPVVQLLYQRGAFDAEAAHLTALLLTIYVFSVPALSIVQLFLAPHYATGDAATPTRHMAWMLAVNMITAVTGMRWLDAAGLALATTITALVSLARSYWLLWPLYGRLPLGRYTWRAVTAGLLAGLAVWSGWAGWQMMALQGSSLGQVLGMLATAGLGGSVYLLATQLLGLDDLKKAWGLIHPRQPLWKEPEVQGYEQ